MRFTEEDSHARALRRVKACAQTLYLVADDLDDPEEISRRADLLLAIEDLADVTNYLLEATRVIAWRDVLPEHSEENYE
jgi:hypothetical protein